MENTLRPAEKLTDPSFALIETMLWARGAGIAHRTHLARLSLEDIASAEAFHVCNALPGPSPQTSSFLLAENIPAGGNPAAAPYPGAPYSQTRASAVRPACAP